jgi:hypothetical protein
MGLSRIIQVLPEPNSGTAPAQNLMIKSLNLKKSALEHF